MEKILVIDDEVRSLETITRTLDEEFEVITCADPTLAISLVEEHQPCAILCDQRMPDMEGVTLLSKIRERWPDIPRLMISGFTDASNMIDAINKAGIYHYVTKPWYPEQLLLLVRKAAELYRLTHEHRLLSNELQYSDDQLHELNQQKKQALQNRFEFVNIICDSSSPLNTCLAQAKRIAPFDVPVMITGESGTGKELMARALHYNSQRKDKPFIIENCGALHEDLLSSELFGHKKGAFTGAVSDHVGLFEQADGGTIFLDEIGETSPGFQVKLLRVLQEGVIRPLGSNENRRVDVRILSATNRDMKQDIEHRRFRADLFYRLTTMKLHLPPLRERPGDIEPIARHLLLKYGKQFDLESVSFSPAVLRKFMRYRWPGNVREMENEIKRMLILATGDLINEELLSDEILADDPEWLGPISLPNLNGSLKDQVEQLEKQLLIRVLNRFNWNKSQAASHLGLSRVGLANKIERYELQQDQAD